VYGPVSQWSGRRAASDQFASSFIIALLIVVDLCLDRLYVVLGGTVICEARYLLQEVR